jgi:hypothetical protein
VWSVKTAGTTGASISGSTLSTTSMGTVEVTATIANGTAAGTDYTQDFSITITALSPAEQLAAGLNAITSGSASASGDSVTLLADIGLVNTTITVPSGVTLDLETNHKSITLGNNAVLTVNGVVNAEASHDNAYPVNVISGNGKLLVDSAAGSPATINGAGVVHLKSQGILLVIESGKKLTLDGTTLDGLMTTATAGSKNIIMPTGYEDGMDNNLQICTILNGAEFTMNSGVIGYNAGNSGIFSDGIFTMNGGEIKGNSSGGESGGIYVGGYGVFTMNSGEIKDNRANLGAGVYVTRHSNGVNKGTFIMAEGTVYGNSASSGLANIATSGAALYCPFANSYWGDGTTSIPNKSNQNSTIHGGSPGTIE